MAKDETEPSNSAACSDAYDFSVLMVNRELCSREQHLEVAKIITECPRDGVEYLKANSVAIHDYFEVARALRGGRTSKRDERAAVLLLMWRELAE